MIRTEPPRVAVLVGTSTGWGRRIIRGIASYANKHGPWHLWVSGGDIEAPLRLPPHRAGEGIIARVARQADIRLLDAAGAAAVNVSSIDLKAASYPRIANDLDASGRLAAEYLWNRGFRHFGYAGTPRLRYVRRHFRGFRDALAALGCACTDFPTTTAGRGWHDGQLALVERLRALPKPAAILTWATPQGRAVLDACHWAGLIVPEQVAVLSGDDDRLMCEICSPPLSGIAVGAEQIGHQAATLLDRLMRGGRPPESPAFVAPVAVVTRRSTDTLAMDNPRLVEAVAYIRNHAAQSIRVEDVAGKVGVSRRQLERLFRETLGRTPGAEIQRLRLERAGELLAQSDLPVAEVAAISGFGTAEYLATLFKQATGLTPLRYRSTVRGR